MKENALIPRLSNILDNAFIHLRFLLSRRLVFIITEYLHFLIREKIHDIVIIGRRLIRGLRMRNYSIRTADFWSTRGGYVFCVRNFPTNDEGLFMTHVGKLCPKSEIKTVNQQYL